MRWLALAGISVLAFTAFLDFTIVNTALPFIKVAFKTTILQLQWVSNIFSMVLTMVMAVVGRFGDIYGRKKVFYLGLFIFGFAALAAGFSPSIGWLILFRGIQGLGASMVFILAASLISDIFPKEEHGHAIGIYGGVTGLGLAIGPLVGGLLIQWLDWRWVFWINLPLIALGFIYCLVALKTPPHKKPDVKIDWKGLFLLIFGLGGLIYGIIAAAGEGIEDPTAWMPLVAGLLLLAFFTMCEKKSKEPLLDLSIFKKKLIVLATLSCSLAGIVSYVFMFFDPLYLHMIRNLSGLQIGLLIAAIPAAQVVISFLFGFLLKWVGIRNLMMISTIAALLAVVLHHFIELKTPLTFLLLPFALLGVNWGLSNAGILTAVNQSVSPAKVGGAIGSIAMVWNMAGSVFLALSSAIFHLKEGTSFLNGFYSVVDFNAVFALIVVIVSIFLCTTSQSAKVNR